MAPIVGSLEVVCSSRGWAADGDLGLVTVVVVDPTLQADAAVGVGTELAGVEELVGHSTVESFCLAIGLRLAGACMAVGDGSASGSANTHEGVSAVVPVETLLAAGPPITMRASLPMSCSVARRFAPPSRVMSALRGPTIMMQSVPTTPARMTALQMSDCTLASSSTTKGISPAQSEAIRRSARSRCTPGTRMDADAEPDYPGGTSNCPRSCMPQQVMVPFVRSAHE